MIERTISADHAGERLDKFLRRLFAQVPASHVYRLIRLRRVRVNGVRAKPETLLAEGDQLVVRADEERLLAPPDQPSRAAAPALEILFEDEDLFAMVKPPGLAVHPGSGIIGDTVVELARRHVGARAAGEFLASPAHRLDRETSGVLLVAKSRRAMVALTAAFTAGGIKKRYLVLAKGRFSSEAGTVDLPLAEHEQTSASRDRRGVNLQRAVTHWRVVGKGKGVTLLACRIETGRTHQIRRHLAAIGHPVAGDRKHGDFAFNRLLRRDAGLRRMFLHAEELKLAHPIRTGQIELRAPLPDELRAVLVSLEISGADFDK